MKICCVNFCINNHEKIGKHHHKTCPKYKTEKHAYIFYLEESINAFIPAPEKLGDILDPRDYDNEEKFDIEFKRVDLTDEEFDQIPEE